MRANLPLPLPAEESRYVVFDLADDIVEKLRNRGGRPNLGREVRRSASTGRGSGSGSARMG